MLTTEENEESGDVLTMEEAVEAIQYEEEEMIAVFGAGDENNCTYSKGYMERQAIFSCKTCDPTSENAAGVCYACSLNCHHNHDLVELYTKRNFKCDCGNSKFKEFKCNLQEVKEEINKNNIYNHNFVGKYCTCERPYPDPEDDIDDEMIQCILCEDWFHSRHLGCLPPPSYEEMVCDQCVKNNTFLHAYRHLSNSPPIVVRNSEISAEVDVTSYSPSKKRKKSEEEETAATSTTCQLKRAIPNDEQQNLTAMFFKGKWRNDLCKCKNCLDLYKEKGVSYLTEESDTIAAYERKGKQKSSEVMNNAADTLSRMNHVQQIELVQGYNDLKQGLNEFFRTFRDKQQVVRKEDIESFFEDLNKKKRQRPPDQCR